MKTGYAVFGKPYEIMLRNDLHDPSSIDHQFLRNMALIDSESAAELYSARPHVSSNIAAHELYAFAQAFKADADIVTIRNILRFTSGIALSYEVDFDDMLFGGTEAEIIARGTDWCADMARVGCALLQCNGIPARIVHLANPNRAYNGHVVCEAYFQAGYGICDFIFGVLGCDAHPISAWDMARSSELVTLCYQRDFRNYSREWAFEGMYGAAAISEYDIMGANNDYSKSKANAYSRSIIQTPHNNQWFMGEDN